LNKIGATNLTTPFIDRAATLTQRRAGWGGQKICVHVHTLVSSVR
jgi:hypothetical protein